MRFQQRGYYCGPASVQNALKVLGVPMSQVRAAKAANADGPCHLCEHIQTDDYRYACEHGIQRAIKAAGYCPEILEHDRGLDAWSSLQGAILGGYPVIACVDRFEHWVCAYGLCGNRVQFFDPARYGYNRKVNGHHSTRRLKFLRRWKASRKDLGGHTDKPYYGIAIGPRL